jgi:integrase
MGKLNALTVKHAKPGQKLSDGDGLVLHVDTRGRGNWFLRYTSPTTKGRERLMALGPLRDVGLSQARDDASDARALIRQGVDPLDQKQQAREATKIEVRRATTFKDYAETYIASHEAAWKNQQHGRAWRNSLRDHVHPHIGHLAVADIDTTAVLKVLKPIWDTRLEMGRTVRQRIEVILAAAKVEKLREGENPAVWRGHLENLLARHKRTKTHHAALPYSVMPDFWRSLVGDASDAATLLRFIIATATRYSEAALADWSEIDPERKFWTVPAARMKGGQPHVVPLSDAARAALARSRTKSGLIFPSPRTGRKMSDVALVKTAKRHTTLPVTTHGHRSTFRDWIGDQTDFPREIAEEALSHRVGNAVERAYRRGNALAKRRILMEDWAVYLN